MSKRGPPAKDSFIEVGFQLFFCEYCGGEPHKGDGDLAKHLTRKCHKKNLKRVAEGGALYTYEVPLSKRARVQSPDDGGVLQGAAGPSNQDNDQDQAHSPPAAPMASPTPAPAPAPELPVLRPPSKTLLSQLREKTKQVVPPDETPESQGNGGQCTTDTMDVESASDEEDMVGAEYAALEKENWLAHATTPLPLEPDFRPRGGADGSSDHADLQAAFEKKILIDGMPTDEPLSAELQDAMRCAIAKQLNKDAPPPREGTVRWCIANHDQPVAPGSNMTLIQACYTTLWLKEYAGMNCRGVDALCRILAIGGMLGTGNIMPRSEHIVKGVLGIQKPEDYAFDLCSNGQCPHVYGKQLPPWERRKCQGERCPCCGTPRFRKRNSQLHPVRSVYILQLSDVIMHLFGEPLFAKYAGIRTQAMLKSAHYSKLDSECDNIISHLASPPSPGTDGGVPEQADTPPEGIARAAASAGTQDKEASDKAVHVHQEADEQCDSDGDQCDPDPSDECMTAHGDALVLLFALFVDGVQLHQHGRSTTTVVSIKCLDLPGFLVNTNLASYTMAFIDGPKEPTCMTDLMHLILGQFKRFQCKAKRDSEGNLTVEGEHITVWDSHRECFRKVLPVFKLAYADTPARRAWALTTGHTSRSGCDKCGLRSVRELPSGVKVPYSAFAGYYAPAPALILQSAKQGWEMGEVLFGRNGKCDKEAILPILMSDDKNRIRSEGAEDITRKVHQENKLPEEAFLPSQSEQDINTHPQRQLTARCKVSARKRHRLCNEPHKDLGSRGVNAFQSSGIPGYDFQMTFVEPLSHTILNGIGKDFLELIFDTTNGIVVDGRPFHVPLDVQHDMDIVIDSLDLPSAFNRPPCQIRGERGVTVSKWLFEETLTFIEVAGAAAFWVVKDRVHPGIEEMWSHYRAFSLYFLQYRPGQHTEAQIDAAQQRVYQFALYAERNLNGNLLTVLLHRAYAHIPMQIRTGLPGAFMREDWGERCVRRTKSGVTGHATYQAARASAALCLLQMGLRILKVNNPGIDHAVRLIQSKSTGQLQDTVDKWGCQLHGLKNAFTGEDGDEVSHFANVLDEMEGKVKRRRAHQVQGALALAGALTREHIEGKRVVGVIEDAAEVMCSDSCSIQSSAYVIRTEKGSKAHGRFKHDHHVYIPFMAGKRQNPCVMKIQQLLRVKKEGMGWADDTARLAVGTLYEHLTIRKGMGLETSYNDDPSKGACVVPRMLFASHADLGKGYAWAVHVSQVHCPVAVLNGTKGLSFMTINKMGIHGRQELLKFPQHVADADDEQRPGA